MKLDERFQTPTNLTESPVKTTSGPSLALATALVAGAYLIPYGGLALYPLSLINTHLHEGAHALAAVLTGGDVAFLNVHPDTSGLTGTRGGIGVLITFAGYFGTALWGAGLLKLCRNGHASEGMRIVAVVMGLFSLVFGWRDPFTLLTGLLLTAVLWWFSTKAKIRDLAGSVLAISLTLNSLESITRLWGYPGDNDASSLQRMTAIPAVVWIAVWLMASAALLLWALRRPSDRAAAR